MTIEDIRKICLGFPHVTEDIKWEEHLCFNVGGKMFIITSPDNVPVTASFKVSDEAFDELSDREGFKPAPYLARYKWIFVDDISRMARKEWQQYLQMSYDLVYAKLPKSLKR